MGSLIFKILVSSLLFCVPSLHPSATITSNSARYINGIKKQQADVLMNIDVDNLCSLTKNPNFCKSLLAEDFNVPTYNLPTLANMVIGYVKLNATDVINYITPFLNASTDQKEHLQYCKDKYNACLGEMKTLTSFLNSKDYNDLKKFAQTIPGYAITCEDIFKTAPSAPSPLTDANKRFTDLVDILVATASLLASGSI